MDKSLEYKIMKKPPVIRTLNVSPERRRFLQEWLLERRVDERAKAVEAAEQPAAAAAMVSGDCAMPAARAFDPLRVGDVRLLRRFLTTDERLAYVAVLSIDAEEGLAVIAPFSKYAWPATRHEWLTGIDSRPLRVLQLWNAHPIPLPALAKSWRACALTAEELEKAKRLYAHAVGGTWPEPELRESVGLAVYSFNDVRLRYQDEEIAAYNPVRALFYRHLDRREASEGVGATPALWPARLEMWSLAARTDAGPTRLEKKTFAVDGGAPLVELTFAPGSPEVDVAVLDADGNVCDRLDGAVFVVGDAVSPPILGGRLLIRDLDFSADFRLQREDGDYVKLGSSPDSP